MTAAEARELATTPDLPILNADEAHIVNLLFVKIRKAALDKNFSTVCGILIMYNPKINATMRAMGYNFGIDKDSNTIIIW